MAYRYTVRRPISDPTASWMALWDVVTNHRTLAGALASLARQRAGAKAQGGYSQDRLFIGTEKCVDL